MHYLSIIHKPWSRLLAGIIAGVVFRLPVDIIVGLNYKNYSVDYYFSYLFLSILGGIILFQLIHLLNARLDRNLNWNNKPRHRFWAQLVIHSVIAFILSFAFRYSLDILVVRTKLFILRFEVLSAFVVFIGVFVFEIIDYGAYLVYKSRYSLAELERFKKENVEFRFETLVNQVNPHFLFNSLNTLSSLVYENQDTAAKYIRELAKVYRYVLESRQKELVPLKEDMMFVKAYIYLLELRFKDMLRFDINILNGNEESMIAPMTIQMLIENAVKHNIISKNKNLTIGIDTQNGYLKVSNNIQLKDIKDPSSGIGLANIKSRYGYFTDKEVVINETAETFEVQIPLIEPNYE